MQSLVGREAKGRGMTPQPGLASAQRPNERIEAVVAAPQANPLRFLMDAEGGRDEHGDGHCDGEHEDHHGHDSFGP